MRNTFPFLAVLVVAGALASGCTNVENKLGRGLSNTFDIARGGEFRRTMEQTSLFDTPDATYTTGVIRGINRTLARTGLGVYEVVTAPFPPYEPIFTNYLEPNPVYPDNYTPGVISDSMFATDTSVGFGGGDVLPIVPGSRFTVFDPH
jgi:putative exosortase-associated protein (TIGR04073 family)